MVHSTAPRKMQEQNFSRETLEFITVYKNMPDAMQWIQDGKPEMFDIPSDKQPNAMDKRPGVLVCESQDPNGFWQKVYAFQEQCSLMVTHQTPDGQTIQQNYLSNKDICNLSRNVKDGTFPSSYTII